MNISIYKKWLFHLLKRLALCVVLVVSTNFSTIAQNEGSYNNSLIEIKVGKNIRLDIEDSEYQLVEPNISSHPTNPDHLLAVGWVYPVGKDQDLNIEKCAVFISKDGGLSWKKTFLSGRGCGDPWVTLTDNMAVLTCLGSHPLLPDSARLQLMTYFSLDGGNNWSKVPQSLGYGHDGPRTVADSKGNIYIASGRGIRTDSKTVRFPIYVGHIRSGIPFVEKTATIFPSNNLNLDAVTTLSDGSLVLVYQDFQRPISKKRSREGILKTFREWSMISNDKGKSFSIAKLVTESCFDRANDLVADRSDGKYRDRLYCVCSGNDFQSILLSYSTDQGEIWSKSIPIGQIEPLGVKREPHIAVNDDGILAVAWMDNRGATSGDCFTPYIAISTDGGVTFSESVKVGSKPSCPDSNLCGEFVKRRFPTGGDYFGFTAAADGKFHLVWSDAREGKFELMTASVEVNMK